jgi:hypothetical protein
MLGFVLSGAYYEVFIAKHLVKPHIFKMAHLPLKTLLRENNARVWNHIFKNGTSTL